MKVSILSGIPGCGKSTHAKRLREDDATRSTLIVSADDFFVGDDGVYRFDATQIGRAHANCFRLMIGYLDSFEPRGEAHLIVDNTNLSAAEISPYVLAANAYGCLDVTIYRFNIHPEHAFARQTHGVSRAGFEVMVARYNKRDLMPWWKVVDIDPTKLHSSECNLAFASSGGCVCK